MLSFGLGQAEQLIKRNVCPKNYLVKKEVGSKQYFVSKILLVQTFFGPKQNNLYKQKNESKII